MFLCYYILFILIFNLEYLVLVPVYMIHQLYSSATL